MTEPLPDWPPPTPSARRDGPQHHAGPEGGSAARDAVDETYGTGGLRALGGRVSWAIVSEVVNLVGTALLFLILAEQLDPDGYGSLQAVVSIAIIAGPLATFGANWQLIRRTVVSADPTVEAGRAISTALVGTVGAAVLLTAVALAVPAALADISRVTIALILVAQMPAYWLVELAATSAVARADLRLSAQMRIVTTVVRLTALGLFALAGSLTLDTWAWFFAGGNVAAALIVVAMLAWSLGGWPRLTRPPLDEFTTGFPYGVGNTTEGFLAASDRPLLKQYGFDQATGIYAAGYRVVSLGFIPMMALFRAQDRRFFRQGANGSVAGHEAARAMAVHGLVATVPVTVALWLAAPLFEVVLGPEWGETTEVIRLLAVLPVIKGFQFAFGNALTAAGNQTARMWLTGGAAIANLGGNLALIPIWSWEAAAATTLVAEVGLAIAFAVASAHYARIESLEER